MMSYETRFGKIIISEHYLEKLIGSAAISCFGVIGMVPSTTKQRILGLFSSKTSYVQKGIDLRAENDAIYAELHIIVAYGTNLTAIADSIIHKVKYTVNQAIGISEDNINISVKIDGIKETDNK